MTSSLSDTVKALIAKARIVSFESWQAQYPPDCIACFQAADDAGRFLTDDDLAQVRQADPGNTGAMIAQTLRDLTPEIVDEARAQVLSNFPQILEPGGGLYPPHRAEACWRDFWHFLRCIAYGIAGQRTDYTSATGLHYMRLLYEELQVPLDAMIAGLEGLKIASLRRIAADDSNAIAACFDALITELARFKEPHSSMASAPLSATASEDS
ncbi:MAG: hypothetical protein WCD18_25790 [Thermosynechococcaceae cyanobacterium]